jgi:hypothetical protein
MLFHIEQAHTPENCPIGHGGFRSLHDANVAGVKVIATYGNLMQHVVYLVVEAHDIDALNEFLRPGMQHCTCRITPVSDHPLPLSPNS